MKIRNFLERNISLIYLLLFIAFTALLILSIYFHFSTSEYYRGYEEGRTDLYKLIMTPTGL